jgi:hypothetical protein
MCLISIYMSVTSYGWDDATHPTNTLLVSENHVYYIWDRTSIAFASMT